MRIMCTKRKQNVKKDALSVFQYMHQHRLGAIQPTQSQMKRSTTQLEDEYSINDVMLTKNWFVNQITITEDYIDTLTAENMS